MRETGGSRSTIFVLYRLQKEQKTRIPRHHKRHKLELCGAATDKK